MNDVSSTKIRLFLKKEMSIQYLIPAPVIAYIEENGLYEQEGKARSQVNGSTDSGRASPAIAGSGSKS